MSESKLISNQGNVMKMFNRLSQYAAITTAGLIGLSVLNGCSTAPSTPEGRSDLRQASSDAIGQAQQNDPSLRNFMQNAAGYAVFPSIGKGAVGIGGAYGKGDVYLNGVPVGYCAMSQGTIGVQLGGQDYTEILVFESPAAVRQFQDGNYTFDAQATATAIKSGAAANAKFANGVCVFTMDSAGLMFEASIGGQKFSYQDRQF
jgi:lipid-binding SYLF domain-containing protein